MSVNISLVDKRFSLRNNDIKRLLAKVLSGEKAPDKSVDVIFCRDREMIGLNRKFKGKNNSTDVLAFDLSQDSGKYLGEIYVNLQMARRQAKEARVPYSEEVNRLAIHGVLHLLGFRDNTNKNQARMWARQESYLKNGK